MKVFFVLVDCILLANICWASNKIPLDFAGNTNATIGITVATIDGKIVEQYNPTTLMTPASIIKCITSAACVIGLDEDFSFITTVDITGEIVDGTLNGNTIITASGDPTISSAHFNDDYFIENIAKSLKNYGIDSIAGKMIVESSNYPMFGYSPYWMLEDLGWYYSSGLYGLNFKDNTLKVVFTDRFTNDYSITPKSNINIYNHLTKGDDDIMIYPSIGENAYFLDGTVVDMNANLTIKCANPNPIESVKAELSGIIPLGNNKLAVTPTPIRIYEHKSPTRDEILRSLMYRSDNLFAQGMLRAILSDSIGIRTDNRAISAESNLLKTIGVNTSGQKIVDGCGLARNNKITPKFMTDLLCAMANSQYASIYTSLFPKVGFDGTVKRLLQKTKLRGKLVLKSGSMSGVLCYSGYKINEDGLPTHAICIMVNNFSCPSKEIRTAIERYLLKIFQ